MTVRRVELLRLTKREDADSVRPPMNVLVIGSGGREHALTWKLRESQLTEDVYCAPGNPGIAQEAECLSVDISRPEEILAAAQRVHAELTVIGPEAPLVAGVVDEFAKAGLKIIGPSKAAAQLEGSKIFAKEFMQRHGIPTAGFTVVESFESARQALGGFDFPLVIKADGLAAGKGVVIAKRRDEAEKTLDDFMRRKVLGSAGERLVIEECLRGEEASFIVLTDGRAVLPFAPTQDHKAVFDNDQGPNTGGMGAYSDDSILNAQQREMILRCIVAPTLAGAETDGLAYRGFLYFGLMMTEEGPKVLEYNVRMGDPEAQPIVMRLRSDFGELLRALVEGRLGAFEAHWSPSPAVCVVMASRGYPGKPELGKAITGTEAAEALGGVKVFHAGTRFENLQLLTTGGRVLGVTAIGEDLEAAMERAYQATGKIQFEGMHFRHDIGAKGLRRRGRARKRESRGGPTVNPGPGGA